MAGTLILPSSGNTRFERWRPTREGQKPGGDVEGLPASANLEPLGGNLTGFLPFELLPREQKSQGTLPMFWEMGDASLAALFVRLVPSMP